MITSSIIIFIIVVFAISLTFVQFWFFKRDKVAAVQDERAVEKAFEQGNFKKVKELLLKVKDTIANPDSEYKLGVAHLKLGEYEESKKCFEKILKQSPKKPEVLLNLAQTLELQGKQDEALETYIKIIDVGGKNVEGHLNVGRINIEKKNYGVALEILEKAKEITPENAQVLFFIAKCKSELSESENDDGYQQAIQEHLELAQSPDLPADFHISLATLYAKNGQPDQAMEFCKKALEQNERDIEAYRLLGLIQLIKKDYNSAKGNLTTALNFQPNNPEIHEIFSYLLCTQVDDCPLSKCREKYKEAIGKFLNT